LQKEIIEERNREVRDSITYAKRIQTAILPSDKLVKEFLTDSFILFKPKDIVSGDFYWMEKIGEKIFYAVVDCTGHGVPGAMVSVVGHNALNRTIKEFGLTEPAAILDKLTELVEETFEKSESEVKDGMDISLCCLDLNMNQLKWAGANNPIWIQSKGEVQEIKADKQPIGKFDYRKPFTGHTIDLEKGDTIYIFTDGYADQFGGDKGKKFKYQQLKSFILTLQNKKMDEQKEMLNNTFESWRGELEQVDDVCVIGVRV
jgi:serine phosphatase RsbU (regulator of sigma subunit)